MVLKMVLELYLGEQSVQMVRDSRDSLEITEHENTQINVFENTPTARLAPITMTRSL